VTPRLRDGLEAAGLPAATQRQVVAGFQACARDRAATDDPTVVPASCQGQPGQGQGRPATPEAGQRVQQVIAAAGDEARKEVFTRATRQTLLFNVGVFLAAFLLSLLLPATPRGPRPQPDRPAAVTPA
jgi:hypothetical protein